MTKKIKIEKKKIAKYYIDRKYFSNNIPRQRLERACPNIPIFFTSCESKLYNSKKTNLMIRIEFANGMLVEDILSKLYVKQKLGGGDVAKILNISPTTLYEWLCKCKIRVREKNIDAYTTKKFIKINSIKSGDHLKDYRFIKQEDSKVSCKCYMCGTNFLRYKSVVEYEKNRGSTHLFCSNICSLKYANLVKYNKVGNFFPTENIIAVKQNG